MSKASQRRRSAQQSKQMIVTRDTSVRIIAKRHMPNGRYEVVVGEVSIPAGRTLPNKNRLLSYLCLYDWDHNPPVEAIAAYLVQTNGYQMMRPFQAWYGWEINFYEQDRDRPETYACRDIIGIGKERDFHARVRTIQQELEQDPTMDTRLHQQI